MVFRLSLMLSPGFYRLTRTLTSEPESTLQKYYQKMNLSRFLFASYIPFHFFINFWPFFLHRFPSPTRQYLPPTSLQLSPCQNYSPSLPHLFPISHQIPTLPLRSLVLSSPLAQSTCIPPGLDISSPDLKTATKATSTPKAY